MGIDFLLNVILNSQKEIISVVAGDIVKAHKKGAEYNNSILHCKIEEFTNIVIASPGGFPKDIDLYQAHKTIENTLMAVKSDYIIILIARCSVICLYDK